MISKNVFRNCTGSYRGMCPGSCAATKASLNPRSEFEMGDVRSDEPGNTGATLLQLEASAQEVDGEEYLSADFWYDTRQLLRENYGLDLQVLALTGASGDQSPHLLWNKPTEKMMGLAFQA